MKTGVFAPSSRVDKDALERAITRALSHDFAIDIHAQCYDIHHQSAGQARQKQDALRTLSENPDIDVIWAACGGNRSATLFDEHLELTKDMPGKPVIGYSDVTFLLNAFYSLTGQINIHGPTLQTLDNARITDANITILKDMARAVTTHQGYSITLPIGQFIHQKHLLDKRNITGTIIGGNLSLMQALIGTPYMPQDKDIILFLEDIGDQLSRYDRMLRHLRHTGITERCRAILIGDLSCAEDHSRTPFGFSLYDILDEHFGKMDIPVIAGLPFGHRGPFTPLPVGALTTLHLEQESSLRLSFQF